MNLQIQQLIGQAIEHFQSGAPKQAEEILVRVLSMQSNSLPALEILGLIKASLGEHLEAAKLLKKAIKLNPQNPATQYNLAKALSESKDYVGSLIHHEKALQLSPNNPDGWLNYGQTLTGLKRYENALSAFNKALAINPQYTEAWHNKAIGCAQLGRHEEAINCFNQAIELQANNAKIWLDLSGSLGSLNRYEDALQSCDQALALQTHYPEAWLNKGSAYSELKQFNQAIDAYDQALELRNDYVDALFGKGVALEKIDRKQEALNYYDKAITLDPSYAKAWLNKGNTLNDLSQYQEAIDCFDKAIKLQPNYADAWANKSIALYELKEFESAITCCDRAIRIEPGHSKVWLNKGTILCGMNLYLESIKCFNAAIALKPNDVDALINKGAVYSLLNEHKKAIKCVEAALSVDPKIKFIEGVLLFLKLQEGDWGEFHKKNSSVIERIKKSERVMSPFLPLAIYDDPPILLKVAQIFTDSEYPEENVLGQISKYSNPKIKIAYFSADFKDHPVAYLTTELFELHDRNRFEVYAFSIRKSESSPTKDRLIAAFDHFIEVDDKTDQAVAELARSLKIDIAIDLGGHTQHARTTIFAHRAAPIQVNYLGFAGTMGASYMDYIVADKVVIPQEFQEFYREKKVYLPNSYMVDDSTRVPSNKALSRADFGLPENKVVFCCFNNSYKFNPPRIASFAKILTNVPNSAMWITENNASFKQNLLTELNKLGIDEHRIIFATKIDAMADHLARYRLADLFLDTSPYNAHTTALDSLKAGVPIITMAGKSFASRVGASLLSAIGLPELITYSEEEFIQLACTLGKDAQALKAVKSKLATNCLTMPLFNSQLYCKHLEAAYQEMYQRYINNLSPADIYINQ